MCWYLRKVTAMVKRIAMCVVWCAFCILAVSNDDLYQEARTFANKKQYDDALLTLERILFRDPLHSDALVLKGHIQLWRNQYREAQETLSEVVERTPEYRDAWIALIHSYYRDGKAAKACSTSYRAQKFLGRSSVLQMQLKTVCQPEQPVEKPPKPHRKNTDTFIEQSFTAAAGAKVFQKAYHRYPWANWDVGYDLKKSRWGLNANMHMQRRKYDTLTNWGVELDCAPRIKFGSKTVAGVRLSLSPYEYFDTVFAQSGVSVEAIHGMPVGFEIDAEARFKWYGKSFVPLYIAGVGKYWKQFLFSTRFFIALFEGKGFLSNSSQVRYYFKRREGDFWQAGVVYGLSPFDNGLPAVDGQIALSEGIIQCRYAINEKLAVAPLFSVAAEQLTQRADFNYDGMTDTRRSDIRFRMSGNLVFHIIK